MDKLEKRIDELLNGFIEEYSTRHTPDDWQRLKGVRIQEPIGYLQEKILALFKAHDIDVLQGILEEANAISNIPERNECYAGEIVADKLKSLKGGSSE